MKKFTKKLVAAMVATTVFASTLAISSSAFHAGANTYVGTGSVEKDYSYSSGPIYYNGTFESGALYNTSYAYHVDGYLSALRFVPVGSSSTMKNLKTHCILRAKPDGVPETIYTEYPLIDGPAVSIGGGMSFITGIAANYYAGGLALSNRTYEEDDYTATTSEINASISTNAAITAYGSVELKTSSSSETKIAGFYQINNL